MAKKRIVRLITLGCSKNLVDSERLSAYFPLSKFNIEFSHQNSFADFVLLNTCGFIQDAKEESIQAILEVVELKKKKKVGQLIVWGCLSQRYRDELAGELPEVDFWAGTESFQSISDFIQTDDFMPLQGERNVSTPEHYAYLKISEGCNRLCSFCAIPQIRGKHRSFTIPELMTEARKLADKGVKELILIAQDLTSYGIDLNGKYQITRLVQSLSTIKGIDWIRLHYAYPYRFPDDLLFEIRNNSKVCKYLDIPFQHINNKVLKSMRRGITTEQTYSLIERIRKHVPDIALRTTILTGYPTESESDFNELCDFVEKVKFNRLGVFAYSHEESTPAGKTLKDTVPAQVKTDRVNTIMEIQREISLAHNQHMVGKTYRVLVDEKQGNYFVGRTEFDSPDVDNLVYIKSRYLSIGDFYNVTIEKAEDYDLFGSLE